MGACVIIKEKNGKVAPPSETVSANHGSNNYKVASEPVKDIFQKFDAAYFKIYGFAPSLKIHQSDLFKRRKTSATSIHS